jgi:hypothetical protein
MVPEMPRVDLKKAHTAVAVGVVVLVIGGLLFRDAGEGAMQLVVLATLIATFGTLTLLFEREDRQRNRPKRDQ